MTKLADIEAVKRIACRPMDMHIETPDCKKHNCSILVDAKAYDTLLASHAELERRVGEMEEALINIQQGIALYLSDPLRTRAHAEVFIELCGDRIAAALSAGNEERP
jgi:hypothetical protein